MGNPATGCRPPGEDLPRDRMGKLQVVARTAVVGVGGAGCNVAAEFYYGFPEADTILIDSDKTSLNSMRSDKKLILHSITAGSGFRESDARSDVAELLKGYDLVYIITGLGGGTGTSISPLVADVAGSLGCIATVIAINPFSGETDRLKAAKECAGRLRSICPMTVVIENDLIPGNMSKGESYAVVNRSIIDFVQRNTRRIVKTFEKNLSRNVRAAVNENRAIRFGPVVKPTLNV